MGLQRVGQLSDFEFTSHFVKCLYYIIHILPLQKSCLKTFIFLNVIKFRKILFYALSFSFCSFNVFQLYILSYVFKGLYFDTVLRDQRRVKENVTNFTNWFLLCSKS